MFVRKCQFREINIGPRGRFKRLETEPLLRSLSRNDIENLTPEEEIFGSENDLQKVFVGSGTKLVNALNDIVKQYNPNGDNDFMAGNIPISLRRKIGGANPVRYSFPRINKYDIAPMLGTKVKDTVPLLTNNVIFGSARELTRIFVGSNNRLLEAWNEMVSTYNPQDLDQFMAENVLVARYRKKSGAKPIDFGFDFEKRFEMADLLKTEVRIRLAQDETSAPLTQIEIPLTPIEVPFLVRGEIFGSGLDLTRVFEGTPTDLLESMEKIVKKYNPKNESSFFAEGILFFKRRKIDIPYLEKFSFFDNDKYGVAPLLYTKVKSN